MGFDGAPGGKGYSGLVKLVEEVGIPFYREWAEYVRGQDVVLPDGAKRWQFFCAAFRRAKTRDFEWREGAMRKDKGRWLLAPDGRRLYEKDWSPEDRAWVDACVAAGMWDEKRGIDAYTEIIDGKPYLKGERPDVGAG